MRYNPSEYTPRGNFSIDEGDYDFTVFNADETTSTKDNEMIELELLFEVGRDKPLTVYEK